MGIREKALYNQLRRLETALKELISERAQIAGKKAGCTTLGNHRIETTALLKIFEDTNEQVPHKAKIDQILCENITDEFNVKLEDFTKEQLIDIIRATGEDLEKALKLLRGEE